MSNKTKVLLALITLILIVLGYFGLNNWSQASLKRVQQIQAMPEGFIEETSSGNYF